MNSDFPHKVVSLNSINHASLVVKAMRSKKSSEGRYQDASQTGMDVQRLDSAIMVVRHKQDQHDAKRAEIEDKMVGWTAGSKDVSPTVGKNAGSENDDSDNDGTPSRSLRSQRKPPGQRNEEDAMEFDEFDDPEDNAELFRGFVAPKSHSSTGTKIPSSKPSSKTSVIASHPTLMTSKGVVIKPGQAIRVKPLGSRAKQSASEL